MKIRLGKQSITTELLAKMCGGALYPGAGGVGTGICYICTDSRESGPGTAFAAIIGAKTDGHAYIRQVEKAGAVCAVGSRLPEDTGGLPVIVCDDTARALGRLAKAYTAGGSEKRIGVTGSVGKTTTKEFIASALASGKTYRSEGNFNSLVGMPLSMLAMPADTEFGIFEMGLEGRGHIASLSATLCPDIAVVTNIGSSHLEFFSGREELAEQKLAVADCLAEDGALLLNAEEPLMHNRLKTDRRALSFSAAPDVPADFTALNVRITDTGMLFDADCRSHLIKDIYLPVFGRHNIPAALIGTAVANICGIADDDIRSGLSAYKPVAMRQQLMKMGGFTVICDCYNASPESMRAAADMLDMTASRCGGRRLALLGDMYELGADSPVHHLNVGKTFAEHGTDVLFTFGELAGGIADGAAHTGGCGRIVRFTDLKDVKSITDAVLAEICPGDVLLVKASRGVAAERVIDEMKKRLSE